MSTSENTAFWIVTGAASGIGAAVVRAARHTGVNVLALDVDEAKGLALASETGALFRRCDISDMAQWQQLVEFLNAAKTEFGSPTHIHSVSYTHLTLPTSDLV